MAAAQAAAAKIAAQKAFKEVVEAAEIVRTVSAWFNDQPVTIIGRIQRDAYMGVSWWLVDAEGTTLGVLATRACDGLRYTEERSFHEELDLVVNPYRMVLNKYKGGPIMGDSLIDGHLTNVKDATPPAGEWERGVLLSCVRDFVNPMYEDGSIEEGEAQCQAVELPARMRYVKVTLSDLHWALEQAGWYRSPRAGGSAGSPLRDKRPPHRAFHSELGLGRGTTLFPELLNSPSRSGSGGTLGVISFYNSISFHY